MTTKEAKRGRPPIYPWDEWLQVGQDIALEKGKDFQCETASFNLLIRRQLSNRGLKATVKVRDLVVTICNVEEV